MAYTEFYGLLDAHFFIASFNMLLIKCAIIFVKRELKKMSNV